MFNERNEIMGDFLDEIAEAEANADPREPDPDPTSDEALEAHYLDWCQRNGWTVIDGIAYPPRWTPMLVLAGEGKAPDGQTVKVWRFA